MDTDSRITAVLALRKAKRIVVFTGAGMSAESGIPTFRDTDGFWQRFPPERFPSWRGLLQTALTDPHSVAEFVLNVVEPIAQAEPNAGHLAVARLHHRAKTTVVTQITRPAMRDSNAGRSPRPDYASACASCMTAWSMEARRVSEGKSRNAPRLRVGLPRVGE